MRVSGSRAEEVLGRIFRTRRAQWPLDSHHLYHGQIIDVDGNTVDDVLATVMRGPRSYTGETVAEIHCHGGPIVIRRILDLFTDFDIRIARPGEFTLRAFLNGKLDLAQSEAVVDLIRSRSEDARHMALDQMEGKLSRLLRKFRSSLVEILAEVEAWIDFPEDDLEEPDRDRLVIALKTLEGDMVRLLATFDSGRVLREGASVLILGRPNVGKSSIMNLLLGEARAIVTEIPGTTRDLIEENYILDGIPLRLIDCAGVRETEDPVEMAGVSRAREKMLSADLILMVIDGHEGITRDDEAVHEECRGLRFITVANKSDLPPAPLPSPFTAEPLRISARTGEGLEELKRKIGTTFRRGSLESPDTILLCNRRHREALGRAREGTKMAQSALFSGEPPEHAALGIREALQGLGEITGETTPQEVLEQIFSRFCIGK